MLEADGFTNEVAKLRYGKVRGELKEIADRARERQSSTASETAAQADEINRAAVMFNSAGCLEHSKRCALTTILAAAFFGGGGQVEHGVYP